MTAASTSRAAREGKRADARKNIEAIVEAATVCLARDPHVSIGEIAKAAGVGRVTLYGHFESRATLVAEVAARAIEHTEAELGGLDLSGDPREALARLLETTWALTRRYGALVVAAEDAVPDEELFAAHQQPMLRVERLIRRGRRSGVFRTDMPLGWQVATLQGLVHGASLAVHRGQISDAQAPALIRDTALAAIAAPS